MTARFRRFVAVGDSFTEGLHDVRADGTPRGWADLVADVLAGHNLGLEYANLAVRSKRAESIVTDQVPVAVALHPDLVTIAAGGNDVLGFRVDLAGVAALMDGALAALAATGATVIVFTGFDPRAQLPPGRLLSGRTASYNASIRVSAIRYGATVVDLWGMQALRDPALWAPDRLHLSGRGHRHVAAAVLAALDVAAPEGWTAAAPPASSTPWWRARAGELSWSREHLAPWVVRKLRGRALGDGRTAKLPQPVPWSAGSGISAPS